MIKVNATRYSSEDILAIYERIYDLASSYDQKNHRLNWEEIPELTVTYWSRDKSKELSGKLAQPPQNGEASSAGPIYVRPVAHYRRGEMQNLCILSWNMVFAEMPEAVALAYGSQRQDLLPEEAVLQVSYALARALSDAGSRHGFGLARWRHDNAARAALDHLAHQAAREVGSIRVEASIQAPPPKLTDAEQLTRLWNEYGSGGVLPPSKSHGAGWRIGWSEGVYNEELNRRRKWGDRLREKGARPPEYESWPEFLRRRAADWEVENTAAADRPLYAFWTIHEYAPEPNPTALVDDEPSQAEVSSLVPGRPLGGLDRPACFVLRGVYATKEEARAALDRMHEMGWQEWLKAWKDLNRNVGV